MERKPNHRRTLERELDAWWRAEADDREDVAEAALTAAFAAMPSPMPRDLVAAVLRARPARLAAASRSAAGRRPWTPGWFGQTAVATWMVAAFLSLAWVFESAGTVRPASAVGTMLSAAQGVLRATAAAVADLATIWRAFVEVVGSVGAAWPQPATVASLAALAVITAGALVALWRLLSERSASNVVSL